jgi:Do/DeqQ family serine protease
LPFRFFGPFRGQGDEQWQIQHGAGSGIVIRPDGYILTNRHVVDGATRLDVELNDDRQFTASVVGIDPAMDLAVIKIDASGLQAARFADTSALRVGEWAIAIGSPFGLDYSLTVGVVSALGRGLGTPDDIEDYIQTDASINPGNSGGPLVNLRGEVMGINTMIAGRGTGIGFAIPGDFARQSADQIISTGRVQRSWIGVSFQELTPELAQHFRVPGSHQGGALVSGVASAGPAQRGGIRAGDIITSIDGEAVRTERDLLRYILSKNVGSHVRIGILRNGQQRSLTVTTVERPTPEQEENRAVRQRPSRPSPSSLGLQMEALTPELARRKHLPTDRGVVVTGIEPGTGAERAGLRPGDVILEADRAAVRRPQQVLTALRDGSALLRVQRDAGTFYTVLNRDTP